MDGRHDLPEEPAGLLLPEPPPRPHERVQVRVARREEEVGVPLPNDDLAHRVDLADDVGAVREGDQAGPRCDQLLESLEMQSTAVRVDPPLPHHDAGLLEQSPRTGDENGARPGSLALQHQYLPFLGTSPADAPYR